MNLFKKILQFFKIIKKPITQVRRQVVMFQSSEGSRVYVEGKKIKGKKAEKILKTAHKVEDALNETDSKKVNKNLNKIFDVL